jgi:hypothetical protein
MKPLIVVMVLLAAAGCGGASLLPIPAKQPAKPAAAKAAAPAAAPAVSSTAPAAPPAAPAGSQAAKAASTAAPAQEVDRAIGIPTHAPSSTAAPAQEVIRQKADIGMGEAGRGYGEGLVATPVRAVWFAKERLVLDRIEHDMQLFKAQDPQGRGPKSRDEFMKKIIQAGGIHLPALPVGQRYVYDPAKEELQVEQPRQR